MHNPTPQTKLLEPAIFSFWRWSLALLLVCGFGVLANGQYPAAIVDQSGQSSVDAALDVPLAYSQHLSALKRSNSQQKDEDRPQPWGLLLAELPQRAVAHWVYRLPASPEFHPSLQTLVQQPLIPRAPPLA